MADRADITLKSMVGIALLMVIIAAGTSYIFMNFFLDSSPVNEEYAQSRELGPTYELGEFVVNLSGTRGYQIIQADIVLEVTNSDMKEDLENRTPQIRDRIIRILRNQSAEDLQDPEIDNIKEQIRENLNSITTEGRVTDVWFTRLVIQ